MIILIKLLYRILKQQVNFKKIYWLSVFNILEVWTMIKENNAHWFI